MKKKFSTMSQPITITQYNATNNPITLSLKPSINDDIITNTEDYKVCLRSLEVPINTRHMPVDCTTGTFKVVIFNEYKPTDLVIPGLVYGVNTFEIKGPIMTVESFIQKLNDIVFKKPSPVQLGFFELDEENKIYYRYDQQFANEHDMIKIYFDSKLQRLFPFDFDSTNKIDDCFRFKAVKSYVPSGSANVVSILANSFSFPKFFTMKAIRVRSTLPTIRHLVSSMVDKSLDPSDVLLDIKFNSAQMYNNDNFLFSP